MRILVATDAWRPQVNGVVHTLESVAAAGREQGATFEFLTPTGFRTVPLPSYPQIRVALASRRGIARQLGERSYDNIHIATEGPIGLATRRLCIAEGRLFTTSFHTRFPEYIRARFGVPETLTYPLLRRFHNAGAATMVATASVMRELRSRGFERLVTWSRGVDHALFRPGEPDALALARPIFLCVGRLAVEKNVEAFLSLDLPGSKVVVGDGPARQQLQQTYPDAHFLGMKSPAELAAIYAAADVLVFPSRTDTFGMVLIEALACGLPVAAYPVPGPLDVIGDSGAGALDHDLRAACFAALDISRECARAHALTFTWQRSAEQFLDNIRRAHGSQTIARPAVLNPALR